MSQEGTSALAQGRQMVPGVLAAALEHRVPGGRSAKTRLWPDWKVRPRSLDFSLLATREPWEVLGVHQAGSVMALAAVPWTPPSVSRRPQALGAGEGLGERGRGAMLPGVPAAGG